LDTSNNPGAPKSGVRGALESILPPGRFADERTLLAGTGQNAVGLVAAMVAAFATQVLITRALGSAAFGVITVATQVAFVGGAATRFGMDMAAVRRVSIDVGRGERARVRAVVTRAAAIAAAVSIGAGAGVVAASDWLARAFTTAPGDGRSAFQAAALALPFVALAQVYLGATRGLKVMRHTLYVYWLGQPAAWVGLMLLGWVWARTVGVSVVAYAGSWVVATAAAVWVWRRLTAGFGRLPPEPGETRDLIRYGAPRAPAALFSQLLFWTDLFVLAHFASSSEVGVYAAAVRAAQVILLFLISVNYVFSPFVADLHAKGERDRLDALFKSLTRWMLAATLPIFIVLAVAPGTVLRLFGEGFGSGRTALLILMAGQLINVATGSVGFILIMVGRTGVDLVISGAAVALSAATASVLVPRYGMEGAAIAGAVTLAVSNMARLAVVWRYLRIQPFTREYLRLAVPLAAGAVAAAIAHVFARGGSWQADLLITSVVGTVAYGAALLAAGLPARERVAARGLLAAVVRRSK
jgi:O-antigen/teichoic acid export membrane protein